MRRPRPRPARHRTPRGARRARRRIARADGRGLAATPHDLADGARGGRGRRAGRTHPAARGRRHRGRRRQLQLPGRPAARRHPGRAGHPPRRRGHQRRRGGPGARLLPDDRRRHGGGAASRARVHRAGARRRHRRADPGPPPRQRHRRPGLAALRPARRGPLRQDDPQRHRVRRDGGLCGRLQYPAGTAWCHRLAMLPSGPNKPGLCCRNISGCPSVGMSR
jgi:hypothetical protein